MKELSTFSVIGTVKYFSKIIAGKTCDSTCDTNCM